MRFSENTMRSLFSLALVAAVIAAAPAAFAQTDKTSTVAVERAWARATPAGAQTGAVYMTLANKANTADLTGASSDVAAKVQIHEMAIVNGVMQLRQLANGLLIPAGGSVTPFTLVDDNGAAVIEKTLAGKPYLMYFGYTYCPEVCPTTLFDLSRCCLPRGPDPQSPQPGRLQRPQSR
jgi:hypothetical protein